MMHGLTPRHGNPSNSTSQDRDLVLLFHGSESHNLFYTQILLLSLVSHSPSSLNFR